MILKQDVIGTASRIVYGRKGEKVIFLKFQHEMIKVQNKAGTQFFVKCDMVCSEDSLK
jgi:hypothetical protein